MVADRTLHWGDVVTIVVYFALCLAVGLWSTCRVNTGSVTGYFLAGKKMSWLPVGASIFSTNVGSQFFIGMAGTAAASGIAVIIFEWHAVFTLLLLGYFFVPVYASSGAYTMPEYLKLRFGGKRLRILLAVLAIFLLVIQKISVAMYAGAVFIQQSVGWDIYLSVVSVTLVTAVYTVIGGLSAVIYTDTLQTVIMLLGSFALTIVGFAKVGGINGLYHGYMNAVPNVTTCANNVTAGFPREDSFHIFRDPIEGDFPWPGTTIGLTPMAILAWCTDQVMVQRTLAAKSLTDVKGGVILASWLKILPFFFLIIPGMISRILFPNEVGCVDPDICERVCQNRNGCSNIAYPKLVIEILPPGVRGIMIAVMLSALMSTLTSVFNSASSMFTLDLWKRFKKSASERELMIVGRIFTCILVVVSIAWIPILNAVQGGQLWDYLQAMTSYLAPPWAVIFVMGIIWKGTTEPGAFFGLLSGLIMGLIRLGLHLAYPVPECGQPDNRPEILAKVHYLYYSIISTGFTIIMTTAISLFTKARPEEKLRRVTWWTRWSKTPPEPDSDEELDDTNPTEEADNKTNGDSEPKGTELVTISYRKRIYNILCCYSSAPADKPETMKMTFDEMRRYRGVFEKPWVHHVVNFNAILVLAVVMFLFGFFS